MNVGAVVVGGVLGGDGEGAVGSEASIDRGVECGGVVVGAEIKLDGDGA